MKSNKRKKYNNGNKDFMVGGGPVRPSGVVSVNRVITDDEDEYVSVNGYSTNQSRVLGMSIDEVDVKISPDTYDRMYNEPIVRKATRILITNILADDLQFAPGANESDVSEKEFDRYVEVMAYCQRCISGLDRPYRETSEEITLNAIKYGNGVGEVTWHFVMDNPDEPNTNIKRQKKTRMGSFFSKFNIFSGPSDKEKRDDSLLTSIKETQLRKLPRTIKIKPRWSYRFVVDDYMNNLGIVPTYKKGFNSNDIIDRDKFIVLTLNKENGDPRGTSCYRPAFNWYNLKTQVPAEVLRFILEESVPKAVGVLPEDPQPYEQEVDEDGNLLYDDPETKLSPRLVPAHVSMSNVIKNFRSGSGAVLPHGAKLAPYKTFNSGESNFFPALVQLIDSQMESGILLQTLAQSEGKNMARAAATVHSDLLYVLIFWVRWLLASMTMNDLLEVGVRKNFGTGSVKYMPFISLGDFVRRDWARDLEVISKAYFYGFLDDTQRAELMAWLNLPKPGPSRQSVLAEMDANGEPVMPSNDRPDKQPGNNDRNKNNGTEKKTNDNKTTGFGILDTMGNHNRGTKIGPRNIQTRIR